MLESVITSEILSGVFKKIVSLIPVVFPVMISFIALRKGLGFVTSVLHSA